MQSRSWANYRRTHLWARDFSKGKLSFNTFNKHRTGVRRLRVTVMSRNEVK